MLFCQRMNKPDRIMIYVHLWNVLWLKEFNVFFFNKRQLNYLLTPICISVIVQWFFMIKENTNGKSLFDLLQSLLDSESASGGALHCNRRVVSICRPTELLVQPVEFCCGRNHLHIIRCFSDGLRTVWIYFWNHRCSLW